jgi:hypothetical protein
MKSIIQNQLDFFFMGTWVKWGIRKKLRYLFLESNDGGLVVSSIES